MLYFKFNLFPLKEKKTEFSQEAFKMKLTPKRKETKKKKRRIKKLKKQKPPKENERKRESVQNRPKLNQNTQIKLNRTRRKLCASIKQIYISLP